MRENRTYGSEGGEGHKPFPTPITSFCRGRREKWQKQERRCVVR